MILSGLDDSIGVTDIVSDIMLWHCKPEEIKIGRIKEMGSV